MRAGCNIVGCDWGVTLRVLSQDGVACAMDGGAIFYESAACRCIVKAKVG